jgi:hypothetical protein
MLIAVSAFAETADVAPSGLPASPTAAVIPIFRQFVANSPATNVLALGIGYSAIGGLIWVSDGGPSSAVNTDNVITLFAPDGTFVASFPQPATDGFGWRDPGYTGDHFLFSAGTVVSHVNEVTLAVDNTFTVPGGPALNRGITVFSKVGNVITARSSTFGSAIFTWTWTIGNASATVTGSCPVTETSVYGLAYDSGRNSLWAPTASTTGLLHEYDPATCLDKAGSPFNQMPEMPTMGGGEVFNPGDGCRLWVINQATPDGAIALSTSGSGHPFGCAQATAVDPTTWGAVKARFND